MGTVEYDLDKYLSEQEEAMQIEEDVALFVRGEMREIRLSINDCEDEDAFFDEDGLRPDASTVPTDERRTIEEWAKAGIVLKPEDAERLFDKLVDRTVEYVTDQVHSGVDAETALSNTWE